MRSGRVLLRGKHVENAAANGIFAHHLHRLAPLVADRLQMRLDRVERQFLAHAQLERQASVVFRRHASRSSAERSRSDGDRRLCPSPCATARWRAASRFRCAAKASGPAARRAPASAAAVPRPPCAISRSKNVSVSSISSLGALIAVGQSPAAAARSPATAAPGTALSPWASGRPAKTVPRSAPQQLAGEFLKRGMAAQGLKQVANGGMCHWLMVG